MKSVKPLSFEPDSSTARFNLSFALMAAIWLLGLAGHFTPFQEWPALFLYVIGSIGLVLYRGKTTGEWKEMYLAGGDLKKSLLWGAIGGTLLLLVAMMNTAMMKSQNDTAMMSGMEYLLVNRSLLYLYPILVIAEEFLWRGIMLSAMIEKGLNKHLTVFLTTLFFLLNHLAVAPVNMMERAMMAMMAFPLGIIGGYIVVNTRNVWGSVLVHMLVMTSMIAAIQIIL
ncbi:CPBP family intramembrane glutamic endopeptidase [Pelodictyon phaeoclathratiforme]|jgi:membrane protease YdiL (CAAX protease family)|uniref:Abortive infection protein n=1 Tax=Pelodictyon phaeoclathratiforme (strain DSM 5477 / BU-1) TaxID=324925 RepID=B4SEN6_PELPB|nr:type II CAAX endopeptidase family protein [Pelodictyon phaeoclathratiforme]ACF43128.1 Abortive infection protein [Pelodictyon phaeoclathratiforme BU-1]MBV5289931.1 CPBP family intramembrane metalloprotease [Pelodictyon phaeoclathratiforme]